MQDKPLRVGVIGTGVGAAVHLPGLRQIPEVDVVAVCAAHLDRARATTLLHQVPLYFDDYRRMFREAGLDAVTIATPPELHHPIAVAAAEAGLHILCEKPMARNAAEARDMFRLARDANIRHAVDYETRFLPTRQAVKHLIDRGYLGELQSVSVTVYRESWRERLRHSTSWLDSGERAGGVLGALGSDYIDTLRWWFGEIHAVAGALPHAGRGDDGFALIVQFASGALATVHVSTVAPVNLGDEIVAVGTEAMLAVQADGRLFGVRRDDRVVCEMPLPDVWGDLPKFPDWRVRPFVLLAREWIRSILTGTGAVPSFEDGMKVQEVLDSVQRSQELQRWIDTSGKKWPVCAGGGGAPWGTAMSSTRPV
ncbi:MAG: Gfo/Idh/MocA family oxidoreductase [Sphaerobacter sp.]|nr:Gfo/Idh/MocA family oxidoreductase [Sphaerobacter sp.]